MADDRLATLLWLGNQIEKGDRNRSDQFSVAPSPVASKSCGCHKPLDQSRHLIINTRFFSYTSGFVTIVAQAGYHLFTLVGNMGLRWANQSKASKVWDCAMRPKTSLR